MTAIDVRDYSITYDALTVGLDEPTPYFAVDRGELTSWPQWPTEADKEVVHDEEPESARSTNWLDIARGFTAGASMGVVLGLGLWWTEIHG